MLKRHDALRQIVRAQTSLDLNVAERRIRDILEDLPE